MKLYELIEALEKEDQTKVCKFGFNSPHSFRGCYDELAFEPAENVTVSDMLACAKSAVGATYQGYKGGDFLMDMHTDVHIANYGNSRDYLCDYAIAFMLGGDPRP